jgi:hypothetical protein
MSLEVSSEAGPSIAPKVALCIDVGFVMFILLVRCAAMSGLSPKPEKVEESARGALLG